MRVKFDLDKLPLDGFTIATHGDRAVGKTHLIGDMLKYEAQFGPVGYINIAGEDGMRTISGLGLGNIAETINEYKDLIEIIEEYSKKKYRAIGLDSLQMFAKLAMKAVTGSDRPPIIPSRAQLNAGMVNEWPLVHNLMEVAMMKWRSAAKYAMATAASDKALDNLDLSDRPKPSIIAPNLPGKEAGDSAGWFDFMGYIELNPVRPGEFVRTFSMVPDNITRVRQRLPKMITTKITLPNGEGGWLAIKSAIEAASK